MSQQWQYCPLQGSLTVFSCVCLLTFNLDFIYCLYWSEPPALGLVLVKVQQTQTSKL